MKRFFKLNVFALVALLFLGVADVWGLGIKKNVALNLQAELSQANGGTGTWSNSTLSWSKSYSNLFFLTDWYNCDLSRYDKMVINTSTVTTGYGWNRKTLDANYRVVITIDEKNYTCSLRGGGEQVINIKTDFKDADGNTPEMIQSGDPFSAIQSIRIGGYSESGSVKINSIYFHRTLSWDRKGRIKFYAQDFNVGNGVTKNANEFSFSNGASISLDFTDNDLSTANIESVEQSISITSGSIKQGFNDANTNTLPTRKTTLNKFLLVATNNTTKITLNYVTFIKKKVYFNVADGRLYFEDFEKLSDASFLDGKDAPIEAPNARQQGKYYLYGGRGKILNDPTFGRYYQNLADADEYTKSLSENFLRYTFTDEERNKNANTINTSGAATIGFWVNGQVAVDYELPLERGSMFCIFSNDRFRKADNFDQRPRFWFDLSCNGWTYAYLPNTTSAGVDIGWSEFNYGEKVRNSGNTNRIQSLFGEKNYANPLDQSQHKFYDDKKWHYVTYVMDNNLMHITIYLDGEKTGEIADWSKLSDSDYRGKPELTERTRYLRNIILGGFTPHGLFYDKQYYSDAALAYDDIALYGKALTQEQIQSIIDQKNYTPEEWHYGDSFDEYNEIKGGQEEKNDVTGLGVNANFDSTTGYLNVSAGQLTIPNVPKGYYVRVEFSGSPNATSSKDGNFVSVGRRSEKISDKTYYIATYKANESGTYKLNVSSAITVRSIVITPYQYAVLKFGQWANAAHTSFKWLSPKNVTFNVERTNDVNTFYSKDGDNLGNNPELPVLSLIIDGKIEGKNLKYEDLNNYKNDGKDHPYIKYTSTAPHVAHIDKEGNITMTGIAGNTTIIAELISDNLYNGSEPIDTFELCIKKEENTLRLTNGQSVLVNSQYPTADSNKNLSNITLTVGGWSNTPTYNLPGVGEVSDSWTDAKLFQGPIKPKGEILDEFDQYSTGTYVAKSENFGDFHPEEDFANNVTPWTLPCRGAYVKFEPLKPGIVTMYLLQNGNLDNIQSGQSTNVFWRPVYITDETGKVVDFVQTATNGRITLKDNFFVGDKRRAQFIESIDATYNQTLLNDLKNLKNNNYSQFRTLIDNWNNAGWRQKVIPTGDGGYMVMSKAIVRYTFNVYPGKTYYLFSNQNQISISGFNFEEGRLLDTKTQYYETAPVRNVEEGNTIRFTDGLNDKQPNIPTNSKDITTVTYERNFAQGKWASICLPFSMNNRQMREQFGDETAVVLLKNIEEDGKIKLIWHVNQDIIAGYPYFILPKGAVEHDNVSNSTITKITVDTYFNSEAKNENPVLSIGSNGNSFNWQGSYNGECYDAVNPYVFEGNYRKETLPAGSYVMSTSGTLAKLTKATQVKPFRAYLKYMGSNANNAKPLFTSIDWQNDETTSIDDIIFQNGILTESTDVYGIDGTVIRHNAQNLSNLSKGVYIVNGKKFVVK